MICLNESLEFTREKYPDVTSGEWLRRKILEKPRLVKKNAQAQVQTAPTVDKFVSRISRIPLVGINSCEPLSPTGMRPGFVTVRGDRPAKSTAGTHMRGFARRAR